MVCACMHRPFSTLSQYSSAFEFPVLVLMTTLAVLMPHQHIPIHTDVLPPIPMCTHTPRPSQSFQPQFRHILMHTYMFQPPTAYLPAPCCLHMTPCDPAMLLPHLATPRPPMHVPPQNVIGRSQRYRLRMLENMARHGGGSDSFGEVSCHVAPVNGL